MAVIAQTDRDGAPIDAKDEGGLFDAVVDEKHALVVLEGVSLRVLKKTDSRHVCVSDGSQVVQRGAIPDESQCLLEVHDLSIGHSARLD